jgi:two-component system, sensor histidine kinase and response regulator
MHYSAHLLVVDDQPENLLVLEELLGEHYAVHPATDALEALAYLKDGGRADLILSDVLMADMDGFELCRRLKSDPDTQEIPLLFLTSLQSPADEARGLAVGAADFIQKPFSPPVLLARVSNHLKLSQTARQLRNRNEELESFSYSVSHDLRAPLRAINGFASILRSTAETKLDAGELDLLDRVIGNSVKLGRLIDDILVYSRATRRAGETGKVNLDRVARVLASELESEAPNAEIDIGTLPSVIGDETALRQALENLLRNAIKFSSTREHPHIEVRAAVRGRELVFQVRDNGVGFDMRFAAKLFGIFQRLHSESEFPGTGVGLAIVKRIVESHGGRIWFEAEPDRGATFFFTLTRA